MSSLREQCLGEDVVFEPLTEACPNFLHSEAERVALECLLSGGPGAYYMQLNTERLEPFLSPGEVNQLCAWTQDYHSNWVVIEEDEMDVSNAQGSGMQLSSACYFPVHSDTPAPPLELGWPEKDSRECMGQARVYTSPPMEDAPSVREVVRKLLQDARQVIAIVTDRLSDSAVINDLHRAASHGVPVYIILNQRSVQENFASHRLRHGNIRVRLLGGKTFCSRDGKMVAGEMKENFVLVDVETVLLGSYSLTWTDAHLHRQLVMVMSGPVVESFDREFRILYAASLPISDNWKSGQMASREETRDILNGLKDADQCPDRSPLQEEILSPFATGEQPIDFEAVGVIQKEPESSSLPLGQSLQPTELFEGPVSTCGPILEEPIVIEEKPIPKHFVPRINLKTPENRSQRKLPRQYGEEMEKMNRLTDQKIPSSKAMSPSMYSFNRKVFPSGISPFLKLSRSSQNKMPKQGS